MKIRGGGSGGETFALRKKEKAEQCVRKRTVS